jgi:hypothetical protein
VGGHRARCPDDAFHCGVDARIVRVGVGCFKETADGGITLRHQRAVVQQPGRVKEGIEFNRLRVNARVPQPADVPEEFGGPGFRQSRQGCGVRHPRLFRCCQADVRRPGPGSARHHTHREFRGGEVPGEDRDGVPGPAGRHNPGRGDDVQRRFDADDSLQPGRHAA